MFNQSGRKEVITNQTNFRDIEQPFSNFSLTLMSLKKEKHQVWRAKQDEKTLKLKTQIKDMNRKLNVYRKYKNEMGVTLNKKEREDVLGRYASVDVEILMGHKMYDLRQEQAAIKIQNWLRKSKQRNWFNIIASIRSTAASKIQRFWKRYLDLYIMPGKITNRKNRAAL